MSKAEVHFPAVARAVGYGLGKSKMHHLSMRIDSAIVDRAAIIILHNAGFDRPVCQREWPIFAGKPRACLLQKIDWLADGFEGKRLSQIAAGCGFFFDAHREADDCRAGVANSFALAAV